MLGTSNVVIVSEAVVKRFWPGQDPIGQRITIGKGLGPQFDDPTRQIVGIVGDVRENGLDNPAPEVFYVPLGQVPEGLTQLANGVLPRAANDPQTGEGFMGNIPLGRLGLPNDVGAAYAYLASDKASFTTGANIVLDGGFTLRPLVLISQDEIRNMNL
jgi:hypothetical protein